MKNLIETTRLTALALAAMGAMTLPAMAQEAAEIDANGDGVMTLDEVQAVYGDVTAESFSAADENKDGALDDDEMVAAQEAGILPKPAE
ncbi:EF-hand domain-containing protein [Litorivita pollutaquae]|nr:EF-hand domain-containing protein [Litorivita pollutaquae]